MSNIGTYKESSLHRQLKFRYTGEEGKTEVNIGDYVCDGQTAEGELIEVQTSSFGPLREKINRLSKDKKIRIIYPVILNKHIELYDIEGKFIRKRKSPVRGCIWDLFEALLYAPELLHVPGLCIELVLLDIVEKRRDDGNGSWRRKGVTIEDKIPVSWHESIILNELYDYNLFIPFDPDAFFTVKDLGEKAGISEALARKCLYVFHKTGLIERTGKQGKAYLYKKSTALAKKNLTRRPPGTQRKNRKN